jgi:hypothetical protein
LQLLHFGLQRYTLLSVIHHFSVELQTTTTPVSHFEFQQRTDPDIDLGNLFFCCQEFRSCQFGFGSTGHVIRATYCTRNFTAMRGGWGRTPLLRLRKMNFRDEISE